ncbi:D-methionine transport system substrate-binding protein [Bacillus thermophilus]|uniref:D-methionine transport system substrate-binding protein n=1 Tax=Siminovitchia thermophila TaxID=1245522 RepID=A0ABS2R0N7_9BACI|nr:MetQ/NlpA family ABC transporter substrate-binding protein [Siminovitchia thermophila]MBM7713144.1 D-methionine transport system substrate-binding protein [Siminovitchia thermophila]
MRKTLLTISLIFTLLALGACGSTSAGDEKKEITIGATAGPYSDQLKEGIIPILEKEGYRVNIVEFNDYIQPNIALNEGEIDANLFQNSIYLKQFNKNHDVDLVASYAVPTAPIALYSDKHDSLDDLKEGMTITMPNDPTNLARSLNMLADFGLITVNEKADPTVVSEKDIVENKLHLHIKPIDPAQTPRSLGDTDFAFINGNFALASGLKLGEAVEIEKTPEGYLIYVTLRKEDIEKPFAKALEKAYHSDEFLDYTNKHAKGYVKPPYQVKKEENE